jgi:two-component system chemotaxis response regulator CheB
MRQYSCFIQAVPEKRVIVVGASAGGVEAISTMLRGIPPPVTSPIFIVLHTSPDAPSLLPDIFSRAAGREARHPRHGERYKAGLIYVARPDHHLLIERDGTITVSRGPRENRHRPAIDPLFRSAAVAVEGNAIGIILSGTLDDGTAGMIAIKERGGVGIVQDPDDAVYPGMPQSAIEHAEIDFVVRATEIGATLLRIIGETSKGRVKPRNVADRMEMETRIAAMDKDAMNTDDRPGTPSAYSCPECGGVLWEIQEGHFERYRCRVGHAYSPENALGAQAEVIEEALWAALKTLDETARMSKKLAANERARGHEWMVERFEEKEREAREKAEAIRKLIENTHSVPIEHAEHQ